MPCKKGEVSAQSILPQRWHYKNTSAPQGWLEICYETPQDGLGESKGEAQNSFLQLLPAATSRTATSPLPGLNTYERQVLPLEALGKPPCRGTEEDAAPLGLKAMAPPCSRYQGS